MRDAAARRVNSIDIARYLCAVMVVAIHAHPFEDVDPTLGFVFTQVVPRIAVPFFFAVSGFFFFGKFAKGERPLKDFLRRLAYTYAAWSFVYLSLDVVRTRGAVDVVAMLRSLPTGSWYHLWFIPAVMLSAALATLLWRSRLRELMIPISLLLYSVGVLGCAYSNLLVATPLHALFTHPSFTTVRRFVLMGFPFFCGGMVVRRAYQTQGKMPDIALPVVALAWLAEISIVSTFRLGPNVILTFGLYPLTLVFLLFLLGHPMPGHDEPASRCRVLSGFTYYAHPLAISSVNLLPMVLLSTQPHQTARFVLAVILTLLIGGVVYRFKDRKLIRILY